MSPKLSKLQKIKKNFKDALLKYIVVKFHNFTWSINHTVSNWKWGRWKLGWVYFILLFKYFCWNPHNKHCYLLGNKNKIWHNKKNCPLAFVFSKKCLRTEDHFLALFVLHFILSFNHACVLIYGKYFKNVLHLYLHFIYNTN